MKTSVIILSLFLSGCASSLVVTKPVINEFNIPSELLDCSVKYNNIKIYNPETLTDGQVILYMNDLRRVINECSKDNDSIDNLTKEYNRIIKEFNTRND